VISFRYHLVSLVAVFLALALGIVVGTTALNGPITTDLRKQVNSLRSDRTTLANQVKALQAEVDNNEQFAATYGAQLVANSLTKQSVVIVGLPGAGASIQDSLAQQITAAGGTVSGRVQLTSDYIDPRRGTDITSLATGPAHPRGLQLPTSNDPGTLGGALLAYVLTGKGEATDVRQVLGGFSQLHMLTGSPTVTPAKNIVVVGTGALLANGYPANAELAFVGALANAGGSVLVAGDTPSATSHGIVALVRNSGSNRSSVSTVDNSDTALGQVTAVLALSELIKSGTVGQYGTVDGADALFPTPVSR
jgi:hypothetical protein